MDQGRRYEWTERHRSALREAASLALGPASKLAAVYLYGSARQTGEVGDVDLGLLEAPGRPPLSLGDFGRLERSLHEASRLPLPPLDLRRLVATDATFAHEVIATGELLVEVDREARVAFEVEVARRFLDTAWLRRFYRAVRAEAARGT